MKKIEHITVTTGASRMSPRSEVADPIVTQIREALARDGRLWDGWSVKILPTPEGGHVYDLLHGGKNLARCWLCLDEALAADMWEAAAASSLDPHVRLRPPRAAPWLAVALTMDALTAPGEAISILGDVERCVAWALIE